MNCSPPGSLLHGFLQATILERVAISPSRGFSPPRNWTNISYCSCITGRSLLQSLQGSPCESIRVIKNNNRRQELLMRMSDPCTVLLEMQNNSTVMERCMKILKRIKNRTNLPVLPSIPPVRMKMNRKIPIKAITFQTFIKMHEMPPLYLFILLFIYPMALSFLPE